MSNTIKDGGPAFPCHWRTQPNDAPGVMGMSLRDYFAAAALQTMKLCNSWSDNPLYWEGVAKSAYVCADAMLKARKS
jgi:hypothetical protein